MNIRATVNTYWPLTLPAAIILALGVTLAFTAFLHDGSGISLAIMGLLAVMIVLAGIMLYGTWQAIREEVANMAAIEAAKTARAKNAKWPEQGKRGIR